MQQGDVQLFQTSEDGDILAEGGVVSMAGGLATAVYLSLFGGNEDDEARPDSRLSWWGNADEPVPVRQYRSEFQNVVRSYPFTTSNLRRAEIAAQNDLSWLLTEGAASALELNIRALDANSLELVVNVEGHSSLKFSANWQQSL